MVKGLVEPEQQIYHCCSSGKTRDCYALHFCTFWVGDPLICGWLIFWRAMPSITVGAALASNQNKLQFNVKACSFVPHSKKYLMYNICFTKHHKWGGMWMFGFYSSYKRLLKWYIICSSKVDLCEWLHSIIMLNYTFLSKEKYALWKNFNIFAHGLQTHNSCQVWHLVMKLCMACSTRFLSSGGEEGRFFGGVGRGKRKGEISYIIGKDETINVGMDGL